MVFTSTLSLFHRARPATDHGHVPSSPTTQESPISHSEIEENQNELTATNSITPFPLISISERLALSPSSSSSVISYGEDGTILSASSSPSPTLPTSPLHDQTQTPEPFPAFGDSGSSPLSTQKAQTTEAELIHPVVEITDKQELGKAILVLAIPMVMGLVVSINSVSRTLEMRVVAVTLSFAFAVIWNGILLRTNYPRASTLILMAGIALMTSSFYAFLGCLLPNELKWIPGVSWLMTLFPVATVVVAFIRKKLKVAREEKDLEKGEINEKP